MPDCESDLKPNDECSYYKPDHGANRFTDHLSNKHAICRTDCRSFAITKCRAVGFTNERSFYFAVVCTKLHAVQIAERAAVYTSIIVTFDLAVH